MIFSFTAMFLMLTCCIPATIAVCEDSSLTVKEGQTVELSFINRRSFMQTIYHWNSSKKQRRIAIKVKNRGVKNMNKHKKYQVSINRSHIFITILKVSIDDTGLYIVHSRRKDTLEVIRLSVEGTDVVTDVDTVISRRGSTVRFPKTNCYDLYFRPTDSSSTGEYFNIKHYTRIDCSYSFIANEEQEGCYVMFYNDGSNVIYIQRIQLSDIEMTMKSDGISCIDNPHASGLPFRLEHQYNGSTIRHIERDGTATLTFRLFPVPYHNNGVYQCISYTDNNKSAISQNKSFVYEFTGLPVFSEGNINLIHDVPGRNISVKMLVYSNPNIKAVQVMAGNRPADRFIVHEIQTLPDSLSGWNGPSVNIPGWEINFDIMFYLPQNITLWIIVGNTIGHSKFSITSIINEPTTPDVSCQSSVISVATCILGILLFCITAMTMVNCMVMKRRRSTTVEIDRSPYTYDEIGTIDYRMTNAPPPIRDVVIPGVTRRMELNRAGAIENIFEDGLSIGIQEGQQDDVIPDENAIDTVDTRTYLSLPCSVRSSYTNNEEEDMTLTPQTDDGNKIESVIELQNLERSSNKIVLFNEGEHENVIQFTMDQLVADININVQLDSGDIFDSDSSNSDVPLAAVEPETQNNLYEAVSSNIPVEHLYNQCENSSDPGTQEVPKEYVNLKIW